MNKLQLFGFRNKARPIVRKRPRFYSSGKTLSFAFFRTASYSIINSSDAALDDICHAPRVMDGTGVGHEIR